ncbi:MAG: alpha/beta fold hydrolase [bacterium]|nr:alpha/beta fold hydrolase [bacterium]
MQKEVIKNRKGKKIVVVVDAAPEQKGLAFVMHGLGGFKEQPHIQALAQAFKDNNYTVVLFDATNSIGESDGKYEDATVTNYYADLEDVISWAKTQGWFKEPFCLTGHSLGGFCIAHYAANHPPEVRAVAPISALISGELSIIAHGQEDIDNWRKTGWKIAPSLSRPGIVKKLKWSHMEDRLKYDLLKEADKLTMPVLLIVGENDESIPPEHQRLLYDKLPGKKELHIIKGAEHTFRDENSLREIREIMGRWVEGI